MIAKNEIAERLRATLAKELRQNVEAITPQHTLRDDLGLNSLDAIELMFKIEEEFDLSIPDEEMQKMVTVGDVIAFLETRLNQPAAPPSPVPPPSASPAPKPASKPKSTTRRASSTAPAKPKSAKAAPRKTQAASSAAKRKKAKKSGRQG